MPTLLVTHEACLGHEQPAGHPERVDRLRAVLAALDAADFAGLLREDGLLVIETQNVESVFARLLGRRWHHYKHLEHLHHFGRATLERLLRQTGFELLHATPRYAGKDVSLAFVRERATRLHPVVARLLAPLAPLDRLALYVNPADELIALARKAGA